MATHKAAPERAPETMEYAETLGRELVRRLGYDGALRTCRENHWSGVLDAVQRLFSADSPSG